jgi:stage II sporulation protein D
LKKVFLYLLFISFLMVGIPVLILGGVGYGLKVPVTLGKTEGLQPIDKESSPTEKSVIIKVYNTSENKIIQMELEEYIKGVVAAEVPALFETEALRAQAITARTFALSKFKEFGGVGCKEHPGADVCDSVHCQAWMSKEERFSSWEKEKADFYWERISKAVDDTAKIVLTYNGELAKSIKYHSTSAGKTEACVNVFKSNVPYLVSVESKGEEISPKYSSKIEVKREDFIKKVKEIEPEIKINNANLEKVTKILSWTEGGRVKSITIGDKSFSGVDIRWAFGLNSADFTLKIDSKNVVFEVKGNGHGVGLSQFGANAMAKTGQNYEAILKHYFKGIGLGKLGNLSEKDN